MGRVWRVAVVGRTFKNPFPFPSISLTLWLKLVTNLREEMEWGKTIRWELRVDIEVRIPPPFRGKYLFEVGLLGSSLGYHEPRRN